jgi:pyruvate,water dikinase
VSAPVTLPTSQGATEVPDRATFELLARRDDVPGALGVREVKFLVLGVDGPAPRLFLANTGRYSFHYDFAVGALGVTLSLTEFNGRTYFRDDRENLAGTVIAHDRFAGSGGRAGLYAVEFWPTDPVRAPMVALAVEALAAALPFARDQLVYHPAGDTQEALLRAERAELDRLGVRVVTTAELFGDVAYTPLNLGEGFGTLRVVDQSAAGARPATVRDVAIFRTLPNDIAHVAGILTSTPQTPLSHINLKAKQNDTPNAYLRSAETDPRVAALLGRQVRYAVTPDDIELEPATQAQVDAWLEARRPPRPQRPVRDLRPRAIVDLDALTHAATGAFGAKSANLGELRAIFPPGMVPDGYAVPFSAYHRFMTANGLYDKARRLMADPGLRSDATVREEMLRTFRRDHIRRAEVPRTVATALTRVHDRLGRDIGVRCRSSTNNEDVEGFNGAGLYDSFTHRPDEGELGETIKQVWASLWNFRAFDEREFHRIDHLRAAMGVALHPNFDDEVANGVAVTKNPYEPNFPGYYVNVQVGESLVTNPDPNATPDELLVSQIGPTGEWETQYIRHSTLAPAGKTVLDDARVDELRQALTTLHEHFQRVYRRTSDPGFAMDVEFKVDVGGRLVVKQARPWVD